MNVTEILSKQTERDKENFLNTLRCKISTKLSNNNTEKIKDAFKILLDYYPQVASSEDKALTKSDIILPNEILGQCRENIPIQKYDILRAKIGPCYHYGIVYTIDKELNIAWVVPLTSDLTLDNILPIKGSRIFKTFYCTYFHPIFLNKNDYTFCNIFDNKKEFDNIVKVIKNYYKSNIYGKQRKTQKNQNTS